MIRHSLAAASLLLALSAGAASAGVIAVPGPAAAPAAGYVTVATATTTMTVNHSYAHLREKPTTKSTLLATLKHRTKVQVLDKVDNGKWTHVRVAGKEGYISTSLLR